MPFQKGHKGFRTEISYIKAGKKISQSKMGHIVSVESRLKMSKALKGRKVWNKGLKMSKAHCLKLSLAHQGDKYRGKNSPCWKGGKYRNNFGYINIWIGGSKGKTHYRYEHILVMEKHLRRKLRGNEIVHHINEVKDDNRFENLQLLTKAEHARLHGKQRFPKGSHFGNHQNFLPR